MADPWELYGRLIGGVPEGITVTRALVNRWTVVGTDAGTMGVAMTHRGGPTGPEPAVVGAGLHEVAALATSWDLRLASLGVAALNAWYARPERLTGRPGLAWDERAEAGARLVPVLVGSRSAVIGHYLLRRAAGRADRRPGAAPPRRRPARFRLRVRAARPRGRRDHRLGADQQDPSAPARALRRGAGAPGGAERSPGDRGLPRLCPRDRRGGRRRPRPMLPGRRDGRAPSHRFAGAAAVRPAPARRALTPRPPRTDSADSPCEECAMTVDLRAVNVSARRDRTQGRRQRPTDAVTARAGEAPGPAPRRARSRTCAAPGGGGAEERCEPVRIGSSRPPEPARPGPRPETIRVVHSMP